MNARASVGVTFKAGLPGRAFSFGIESGEIEALKWAALVSMLVAHVSQYVFGVTAGWSIEVGRLAFPLFGVAFAVPLALDPAGRGWKAAVVLFPFAVAAQALAQPMRETSVLNILFLYLSCGAWFAAEQEVPGVAIATRALCLVVSFLSEFSLPGLFMLLALVRLFQTEQLRWAFAAIGWLLVVGHLEGSFWGLAAFVPIALVVGQGVQFRRLGAGLSVAVRTSIRGLLARKVAVMLQGLWDIAFFMLGIACANLCFRGIDGQ